MIRNIISFFAFIVLSIIKNIDYAVVIGTVIYGCFYSIEINTILLIIICLLLYNISKHLFVIKEHLVEYIMSKYPDNSDWDNY